jgi:hypothetical protein
MKVEIGTEAAQFFFWEYINRNFFEGAHMRLLDLSRLRCSNRGAIRILYQIQRYNGLAPTLIKRKIKFF